MIIKTVSIPFSVKLGNMSFRLEVTLRNIFAWKLVKVYSHFYKAIPIIFHQVDPYEYSDIDKNKKLLSSYLIHNCDLDCNYGFYVEDIKILSKVLEV